MLKNEFPIFKNFEKTYGRKLVYLDSAATTHKPQIVIDRMVEFMSQEYGSVHRGSYLLSSVASEGYELAKQTIAAYVSPSVKPEQVVFTKGTTEALNILAYGLGELLLDEKSRVVLPVGEHHANMLPWQQACYRKNSEIAYIPLKKEHQQYSLDLEAAAKLISSNTKIVTLAHTGNVLGQKNPIKEIIALAKKQGAVVILDCAQNASHLEDLFAMGVDAIAFSAHKIYGPTGVGALILSEDLLETLPPFVFGGGMVSAVTLEEGGTWSKGASRFEAGTPAIIEVIGFAKAVEWIQAIGRDKIEHHLKTLSQELFSQLSSIHDIELFQPQGSLTGIVSFRHKHIHAHDLATILDQKSIAVRTGHHCAWPLIHALNVDALVRCSFGVYNDMDDVVAFVDAIKNLSIKLI